MTTTKLPPVERVLSRCRRQGRHLVWTGCATSGRRGGYGQVRVDGRTVGPHWVTWEADEGPVPPGHVLQNLCGERLCVLPQHWEALPLAEACRRQRRERVMFGEADVIAIREFMAGPRSYGEVTDCARAYGVHVTVLYGIHYRRLYAWVPEVSA